jgi:hypothetical protein
MSEIANDAPSLSCYYLFYEPEIVEFQRLAPDLYSARAGAVAPTFPSPACRGGFREADYRDNFGLHVG